MKVDGPQEIKLDGPNRSGQFKRHNSSSPGWRIEFESFDRLSSSFLFTVHFHFTKMVVKNAWKWTVLCYSIGTRGNLKQVFQWKHDFELGNIVSDLETLLYSLKAAYEVGNKITFFDQLFFKNKIVSKFITSK